MTFPTIDLVFDYPYKYIGQSLVIRADCFDWCDKIPENIIHGVITDPPYGLKEYRIDQLEKRKTGVGGIWRQPPKLDGCWRSPVPRFTVLTEKDKKALSDFFVSWSKKVLRVLRPGGHVFVSSNAFISNLTFSSLVLGGLEFRGEIIRLVRTLRGGDRPKNAEKQFPGVSSMPRGCYEPWGLFRKPLLPKMTVKDCLKEFGTGGLRRGADGTPFCDVIFSGRTPKQERNIAKHPSLKPQSFLRQLAHSALPLGEGLLLDPFMGSGSMIAAAEFCGFSSIGIENNPEYYDLSCEAIPKLITMR